MISAEDLGKAIVQNLGARLLPGVAPMLPDEEFYVPTLEEVKAVLGADKLDKRVYKPLVGDCDKFAYLLKTVFILEAWDKKERAYSMGIVWGLLPTPHAINWVYTKDGFYFIEPQTDEIFKPRKGDKVWLIMA